MKKTKIIVGFILVALFLAAGIAVGRPTQPVAQPSPMVSTSSINMSDATALTESTPVQPQTSPPTTTAQDTHGTTSSNVILKDGFEETDNWVTEEIGQSGITFSYPPDWHLSGDNTNIQLFSDLVGSDELNIPEIVISLDENALAPSTVLTSLEEYALDEWFILYEEKNFITVDGHNALFLNDLSAPVVHTPPLITFVDISPEVLIVTGIHATVDEYSLFLELLEIP